MWIIWQQQNDLVFISFQWYVEKTHQVVWDSMLGYGRLECQCTLLDLNKASDVAYEDVLNEFDSVWCVKGLIVTHIDIVVTWKVRPQMGTIS